MNSAMVRLERRIARRAWWRALPGRIASGMVVPVIGMLVLLAADQIGNHGFAGAWERVVQSLNVLDCKP